jgi:hypothetical protein
MVAMAGSETDRLFHEGQEAARQGDTEAARTLLTQVVERDPQNEQAWMWLSGVVGPDEQQICLENVLVINPDNAKARRGLDYLQSKNPSVVEPPHEAEAPGGSFEHTSPLSSGMVPAHDFAPDFSFAQNQTPLNVSVPGTPESSGPGLPAWLEAAIANGQPADAEQAPAPSMELSTPEGVQGVGQIDWRSSEQASAPAANEPPPWASDTWSSPAPDQMSHQAQSSDFAGPAAHLSSFDLPSDVQPFTPYGDNDSMMGGSPAQAGMSGFGPMGPMGPDIHLPQPDELPTFKDEPAAQPWYLQGTNSGHAAQQDATGYLSPSEASASKKEVVLVACPSCSEQVPDTSLACPNCRYSFFVNCPSCHELVDAVDAKPKKVVPCPYCATSMDRFELGVTGTEKGAVYLSERARSESESEEAMQKIAAKEKSKRHRNVSFGWAVDLMWLVVIVAAIWALTQLPTWLKLTGQY